MRDDWQHYRVIPRDLFNDSKLLKCLGRLALIHLDGIDDCRQALPPGLTVEHDGEAFDIRQNDDDGGLWCENVIVKAGENRLHLYTIYNSKDAYPLYVLDSQEGDYAVFDDNGHGNLNPEFIERIAKLCGSTSAAQTDSPSEAT